MGRLILEKRVELPGDFPGKEKGQVWALPGALGLVGDIWAQGVATASVGSWVVKCEVQIWAGMPQEGGSEEESRGRWVMGYF